MRLQMFKIKSADELRKFLRVVAQEAVNESYSLYNDPGADNFGKNFGTQRTYNLTEEDEEEEAVPEEQVVEPPPSEEAPEEPTAKEFELPEEITFDIIVRALNTIRAGKSTKDKEIKTEFLSYFNRLDGAEKKALYTFLESLGEILTLRASGDSVQDPEDPPVNIDITDKGDPEEEESKGKAKLSAKKRARSSSPTGASKGEDTSPPIRVGGQQDLAEMRERVRELMRR